MKMKNRFFTALGLSVTALVKAPSLFAADKPIEISGRYPHLAMFNHNAECGTGAVVAWADRLWVITYAPHAVSGSDGRLYEIDSSLQQVIRPESIGGTPADRMIHRESKRLIIGPYFIDGKRNVRAISPKIMPGRLTAAARHLTDPADKVLILNVEGHLYEVDVKSLAVNRLFARVVPGAHGKGAYSSQRRLVTSNNGARIENPVEPTAKEAPYDTGHEASGVLAEWDGKGWRILELCQFTEVNGPGGKWSTLRMPKADDSYDGKHGRHTEWPRIREVGEGRFLMNMHGSWFDFQKTMNASNSGGLPHLKPVCTRDKQIDDFCEAIASVSRTRSAWIRHPRSASGNRAIFRGVVRSLPRISSWSGLFPIRLHSAGIRLTSTRPMEARRTRRIRATHEASAAFRVTPIAMAIGQGGGVTAALAAREFAGETAAVPYERVREVLLAQGPKLPPAA